MTADPTCVMPVCMTQVIEYSVWCFEHRPTREAGLLMPWDVSNPDRTEQYPIGAAQSISWHAPDGLVSRTDGPAMVILDQEGRVQSVEWRLDGLRHREDGPAFIRLTRSGWYEAYYRHGALDSPDGKPSSIHFREDGSLASITYFAGSYGRHRLDGPAVRQWNFDRSLVEESWFIEDDQFPGEAAVAVYVEALAGGAPREWARAFALGETTDGLGWSVSV